MIENQHRKTWGVTEEQRKADVLAELRRLRDAGTRMTVIQCGPGIYSQARKAFGSWSAALEALDGEKRKPYTPDAHASVRELDAVSPWPFPGLPDYMRERQIVGGRMLEILAESAKPLMYEDDIIDDIEPRLLLAALTTALDEWEKRNA